MLAVGKMKSREKVAKESSIMMIKNFSQSNQVSSQTLTIPERITHSVKSTTRPNTQDHKTFISKIFSNNNPQGQDKNNRLSRPNTNTTNSSGVFSRKQNSFNRTQYTPFSSETKSTGLNFQQSKEKIIPFSTYVSNGSNQNQHYSSTDTNHGRQKETHLSNFVNSQKEGFTRRQSLIESQLQGVFEDAKNSRSSFSKQINLEKPQIQKELSSKKSYFAVGGKITTPKGKGDKEERASFTNANDRFSSSEFMQFAKKKSILGGESFHQYSLRYKNQNDSNLADTSDAGYSNSPQKNQFNQSTMNPMDTNYLSTQQQPQQTPLIHQLTLFSHNPRIGSSQSSSQILDQRKSYLLSPTANDTQQKEAKEIRTSEQIMKDFFPHLTTKTRVQDGLNKKNEQLIQQKKKRIEQYDQIFNELKNKRKTFSKFAFKSHEKQDNAQIRPVLEDLADGDPKGTMSVIDLWSDKNINKFLGNCKLIKDKLLISKIAAIKKRRGFFLDEKKPFLLSRKDELNLINKVYMNEQSKQFQEKYSKQLKKVIQNTSEINKSQLGTQQITSKKLSEQKCTAIGCKHKLCRQHLKSQQTQQQIGLSKKLIEFNLEDEENDDLDSSHSSDGSQLSIEEVHQKKINNYNQFLRQSNIIKAPFNNAAQNLRQSIMKQQTKAPQNKNLNIGNLLKLNNNMIRDLDYLQEQNDKDYVRLVETINTLQDRIVHQKVNNYEAQSSGNEY